MGQDQFLKNTGIKSGNLNKSVKSLNNSLPNLEPLMLNMPLDTSIGKDTQKTQDQGKDTSISEKSSLTDTLDELLEPKERTPKFKKLQRQYEEQVKDLAGLLALVSPLDAMAIVSNLPTLSDTTIGYAEVNKDFCSVLEKVLNASPLVAMISAYSSVVLAILTNHGMNPLANFFMKQVAKNGNGNVPGVAKSV